MNEPLPIRFLEGERVSLRPLEESDLERCHRWINDPAVRRFLSRAFPINMMEERRWFESLAERGNPPSGIVFAIVLNEGNRHIGNTGLHGIDWINRDAESGSLIGEKECWGLGYGKEAKRLLLEYAFDSLGLERVSSRVLEFNARSARHLLSCGYSLEGRRRRGFFREGRYWDELCFGILAEEWREHRGFPRLSPEAEHEVPDPVALGAN